MAIGGLVFIIALSLAVCAIDSAVMSNNRQEKLLLNPLTILTFENTNCSGSNGLQGTCMTAQECLVGLPFTEMSGSCASGLGVCCIMRPTCGSTTNFNNTLLESPDYNSAFNYALDCEYRIIVTPKICQLRLEFTELILSPPDTYGVCQNDFFKTSHDNKIGKICGNTTDIHFYLDVEMSSYFDTVAFQFHTVSSVSYQRKWMIKVARISCGSDWEVPNGCGQYFTGTSGIIKGFNYDGANTESYYLHDQNYGICVRLEQGYCSVTYVGVNRYFTRPTDFLERMDKTTSINDKYTTANNIIADTRAVTLRSEYIMYYKSASLATAEHVLNSFSDQSFPTYYFTYTQNTCS